MVSKRRLKKRVRFRFFAWIMILFLLLLPVILPPGISLICFREDGHIAVEFVQSCRIPTSSEGGNFSPTLSASWDPCGRCTDLKLASDWEVSKGHILQSFIVPVPMPISALPIFINQIPNNPSWASSVFSLQMAAIQLKTVILLI